MTSYRSRRGYEQKLEELTNRSEQTTAIKLENIYSQWNIHEDQDTGEDLENESYADVETAVRDISFEFSNNEKIALIGKVGCGKTSLLLTILKELCILKGKI